MEQEANHVAVLQNNIDHAHENIEPNENEDINNGNEDDGNAFEEGGWNPDAILEDLTWEKVSSI